MRCDLDLIQGEVEIYHEVKLPAAGVDMSSAGAFEETHDLFRPIISGLDVAGLGLIHDDDDDDAIDFLIPNDSAGPLHTLLHAGQLGAAGRETYTCSQGAWGRWMCGLGAGACRCKMDVWLGGRGLQVMQPRARAQQVH